MHLELYVAPIKMLRGILLFHMGMCDLSPGYYTLIPAVGYFAPLEEVCDGSSFGTFPRMKVTNRILGLAKT